MRLLKFGIVAIMIFTLSSCEKQKQEKIEQSWKLVKVSKIHEVTYHEVWDFEGGVVTMIQHSVDTTGVDTVCTGNYDIEKTLTRTYINTSQMTNTLYNGKWRVLEVNNDIMILHKHDDISWLYREFVIN